MCSWGEYLRYGLPAAAMIGLEWWAYEIVLVLAGTSARGCCRLAVEGLCHALLCASSSIDLLLLLLACMHCCEPVDDYG
jgi:hypothetical protein